MHEDDDAPVDIGLLGHVTPFYPYDPDDPSSPKPKKRDFPFGFAAPIKARRSPKRARPRKR